MRRIVLLAVTSVLFIGAVIGVFAGFNVPTEREKHVTHLTYDIEGSFGHQAYGKSTPEVETTPRYFMKIIDSIDVHYSYQFLTGEPVTDVTEEVEISAIVSSPGVWQTEVILVPKTEQVGAFTISFPLERSTFSDLAANITAELGVGTTSPDVVLKASVHTTARTKAGTISDNFIQTYRVKLTSTILEWDSQPVLSEMRYAKGLRYVHHGNFGYTIQLKDNILFGPVTMVSEILPPGDPVALEPSESYDSETIDRIEGTFSYKVESSEGLSQVINEVEVTAMGGKAEGWHETFVLVPRRQETGDFSVTFPLDVPLFYAIIKSIEKETDASASSHELIITADVHTVAQSQFGPIDETLSQSLTVGLTPDKVVWPELTPETKSGSFEETLVVSNPTARTARIGSLGALGMIAMVLLYSIWSYWEFKRKWISRIEADTLQARSKQDLVVDVETLPDIGSEETVIELVSLSELIKAADALLKPVLRLAEPERHIYCVIDGMTRYQYVSLSKEYVNPSKNQ